VPSQERGHINYILCNDLPTLAWLANAANLEVHTFMHRAPRIERTTQIAFDLDPGPGCDAVSCGKVALLLKERLDALGLDSFVKVSGSKGVQMHVPLNTPATYEDTKLVSRTLAFQLAKERPDEVTGLMRKELRTNKVFIDWSQNDEHKTTVCVYSMRGTEKPSVAAPLEWDELRAAVEADDLKALRFTPEQALKRVDKLGDLFADVETLKQKLPTASAAAKDKPAAVPRPPSRGTRGTRGS
jgi:bifunctional non-homologous end joining protein LigD